ncbi:MAG: hypothetical protein ACRCYV_08815 [Aeromonas sp.]
MLDIFAANVISLLGWIVAYYTASVLAARAESRSILEAAILQLRNLNELCLQDQVQASDARLLEVRAMIYITQIHRDINRLKQRGLLTNAIEDALAHMQSHLQFISGEINKPQGILEASKLIERTIHTLNVAFEQKYPPLLSPTLIPR